MIQRYELEGYPDDVWLDENKDGELVKYSDYQKLEQENKDLKEDVFSLKEAIEMYLNGETTKDDLEGAIFEEPLETNSDELNGIRYSNWTDRQG